MKKMIVITAVMGLLPSLLYAQTGSNLDKELDAELNQASAQKAAPQVAPPVQSEAAIQAKGDVSGQPIYIVNQATPAATAQTQSQQTAVQKQPQVEIAAAPLAKSKAEQIREARQQEEVSTENKIVEKLEVSRIEDEKHRANVLFGEPFAKLQQQAEGQNVQQVQVVQQPVAAAVVAAPVAVQPVAPVVVKEESKEDRRAAIREELKSMQSEQKAPEAAPVEAIEQRYAAIGAGIGDYPDAMNVRGNYILNASYGTRFDNEYEVEGTFSYGSYTVDQTGIGSNFFSPTYGYVPNLVDVHQYSGSVAAKYLLLSGKIRPVVGAVASYSYRQFSWAKNSANYYGGTSQNNSSDASSQALDAGGLAGIEIGFGKKWSLGADFRYMKNIASQRNFSSNSFLSSSQYSTTSLDKLDYYMTTVSLQANF